MKFCCPKCRREEEIIGDTKPKCLICNVGMVQATASYKGLWMSPHFVIARMKLLIEKYGYHDATTNGRFKKEREAWTSGMYALGLSEMQNRQWWVEIETDEQTPDTLVHYMDQSSGRNCIQTQSVEIVDWEEHVDDAVKVIKQKCQRAYPPYFWLLVLARNGKNLDVEMLTQEVLSESVPFGEIWIIGCLSEGLMTMVRIVPTAFRLDFETVRSLEKLRGQSDVMRKLKRGTSTEVRDLGFVYLPLP
jgi:hypothetical protein